MPRYPRPSSRPSRTSDAAPVYEVESGPAFSVTMAERGRLVLPAAVRARLGLKEGDRLTLRLEPDGTLTLQTSAVFARSLRGMFKHLAPGRSLVGELIADRRREAAIEDRKSREALSKTGRPRTR